MVRDQSEVYDGNRTRSQKSKAVVQGAHYSCPEADAWLLLYIYFIKRLAEVYSPKTIQQSASDTEEAPSLASFKTRLRTWLLMNHC